MGLSQEARPGIRLGLAVLPVCHIGSCRGQEVQEPSSPSANVGVACGVMSVASVREICVHARVHTHTNILRDWLR